jgi:VWFA-related protein
MRFLAVLVTLALSVPLAGGSGYVFQQRGEQTISVDVDRVNVVFTVFDNKGRFITGLEQDRFKVFEDNKPQTISNFSKDTNLPLSVALLIDTSASVRDKIRFEQEAAIEFFYSILQRKMDQGLLVTFDDGVDLAQDYTDDPEALAKAVRKIRPGGATSLYDAMYLAASKKLTGQQGRRVIILISDGEDNSSETELSATLEEVQRNDVVVYAISTTATAVQKSKGQEQGDKVLKRVTDETGGKVFFPRKLADLTVHFQNISEELRAQYSLAYRPTNVTRDGAFRKIRVEAADKGFQVRSRTGYYAPRGKTPGQ